MAKSLGERNRRRLRLPLTRPEAPTADTKQDWVEIAKRLAPLLLPWVFARRFVAALRWVHVGTLSINGKDEEALRLLRRLPADMQAWSDWRLKELQLLSLLQWNQEALDKANAFLLGRAFSKTTDENSRYFTCFAQWLGQRAFLALTEEGPIPSLFVYDVDSIDLTKVKDRWKRQFPLRVHPDWKDS